MKRIPLIILILLLIALTLASRPIIFAQSGESTSLDENSASLSIVETVPVTASVEVNINGQSYMLAIPVTVNIDAQKDLADALLTSQAVDRVGDVRWIITGISEYEEEFDLNDFSTLEPSSADNKLVVIESDITNFDAEPFLYYANTSDRLAYDDLGNLYSASDEQCDEINPGDTQSCTFVFDVPLSTNIQGMDVKVIQHKRIPFTAQE